MDCDVAVVGGGPAGCAAALVLLEAGLSVSLIDPDDRSVLRVGESLPAACGRLLARLGLGSVETFLKEDARRPCVAHESAWASPSWERRDAMLDPEGGGWHIDRAGFDRSLYKAALQRGANSVRGEIADVTEVRGSAKSQFELRVNRGPERAGAIKARWLVDATGRTSRCGKALGVQRERISAQMAVARWFEAPSDDGDQTTRIVATKDGWWYSARLPNGLRVVVFHCLPEEVSRIKTESSEFAHRCNSSDLLPYSVTSLVSVADSVVRDAGMSRLVTPAGERWLAVGDAAIGFDPLSSQGLLFALYSGVRGAEAILQARTSGADFSGYTKKVESVFVANRDSRMYHYTSVLRFREYPYWRQSIGLSTIKAD